MKQTSEIEEIKAALKRAAYQAVHGTREERAGRFPVTSKRSGRSPGKSNRSVASRSKGAAVRGR